MGFATEYESPSELASKLLIVQVLMLILAVFSYLLRILVKYRRSDFFGIDDILALLALLFFTAIETVMWHSRTSPASIKLVYEYTHASNQFVSHTGIDTVLYWSVAASSQLSIFWFYRFVCSGFSWGKLLLSFGFVLTVCGWAAFTTCDSLNLAYTTTGQMSLSGYKTFETASMILEPLCTSLILGIQIFRLHHIRDKFYSKPYLVLVPAVTAFVIVTSVLRLVYFLRQNIVPQIIWAQIHLGVSVLFTSMPVYAGLETMCCRAGESHSGAVEMWVESVSPPVMAYHMASRAGNLCCNTDDIEKSESIRSFSVFPSPRLFNTSQWSPVSRRFSIASTRPSSRHGQTREVFIEPETSARQAATEFLPAGKSPQLDKGTRRFMLEG